MGDDEDLFNHDRTEDWQRDLRRGDYFLILVKPGMVVYGRVTDGANGERVRGAQTFSESMPGGAHTGVEVNTMDVPLTYRQFHVARVMKWPSHMPVVRAIVAMTGPGEA